MNSGYPLSGGCTCRHIRYQLESAPLFVNCCHCRWCQRETGSSFALNAMIESEPDHGAERRGAGVCGHASQQRQGPADRPLPELPGRRLEPLRRRGHLVAFVRVGTLDDPDRLPPDIHIFTASKQPWVIIPPGVPAVAEYYDRKQYWPADSLARREAVLAGART